MGFFFTPIFCAFIVLFIDVMQRFFQLFWNDGYTLSSTSGWFYLIANLTQLGHYLRSRKKYRSNLSRDKNDRLQDFGRKDGNSEFERD